MRSGWISRALLTLLATGLAVPVSAAETRTFTYDARGRLVNATSSGTVNNGRSTTYCYDNADNRSKYVSDTSGAPASCSTTTCTLTAMNVQSTDEFSVLPRVEKVGTCPTNVTLSYSIQYISGVGNYTDGGFSGGNILGTGETYKGVWLYPTFYSVPDGETLVLKVTFSTTTPGVTISPNASTVTIWSSY